MLRESIYCLMVLRPSLVGAAARLKLCIRSEGVLDEPCWTYVVALLPGSTGTETETNKGRPCATLEEEDGEDDTERGTEGRADEHGAQTVVPLA